MNRRAPSLDRFGPVIWARPSRHDGLEVTVIVRRQAYSEPFLAYLHTPDRSHIVAIAGGPSPERAADRVDRLLAHARTYRIERTAHVTP